MVVHDFYVVGVAIAPHKANPPPIVDANAVLPFAVPVQRFEAVARRRGEVAQVGGDIQLPKFALRHPLESPETPYAFASVQPFRSLRAKGLDHAGIL